MLKIFIITWLIIAPPSNAKELSLLEAQNLAIESSLQLKSKRKNNEANRLAVKNSEAAFYPELEAKAGIGRSTQKSLDREWFASIVGRYNLFRGGRDQAQLKIATLENELSGIGLKKIELKIANEVSKLFYKFQLKHGVELLLKEAIKNNMDHKKFAEKARRSGQVSSTDISEFILREASLQSRLLEVRQDQEVIMTAYKILSNREGITKFVPMKSTHVHLIEDLNDLRERARINNVDLKYSILENKKIAQEKRISRSAFFPSVDLEAEYGFLSLEEENEPGDKIETEYRLVATWNLFRGGSNSSQVDEKILRQSAGEYSLGFRQSQLNGTLEIITQRLKTLKERHHLAIDRKQKSASHYRAVKKEYLRGYKNSADLSDSMESFLDASIEAIELEVSYLLSLSDIESLIGESVRVEVVGNEVQR